MTSSQTYCVINKKILLDECVQANKELKEKYGYINASDIVIPGTSDQDLLQTASKQNLVIVTADIRFVLHAVSCGQEIIYQNRWKTRIRVIPQKYYDPITSLLLESDEVILP